MLRSLLVSHTKILLRDRSTLFWTAVFPLILATLFYFAFSNLMDAETFEPIPIAVVDADKEDNMFEEAGLFDIRYVSETDAADLLETDEIDAYILSGTEPQLIVKESGYAAAVTKAYMDSYQQIASAITNIMIESGGTADPEAVLALLQPEIADDTAGYTVTDDSFAFPDYTTNFFFTLMAMTCMYAGMSGVRLDRIMQVNQRRTAARIHTAPVYRSKLFLGCYIPVLLLQILISIIVYAYVRLILGVSFGNDHALIILTGVIGAATGTTIGALIGLVTKIPESLKENIVLAISMVGSFLAGMMSTDMKYLVQVHIPILAKINPVNLITDAYYSLYYYPTYERFTSNVLGLILMCSGCLAIILVTLRRQRYETI